jgi:endoglycosylceramidase
MWLKVIDYFRGETNVIGYDIINEPTGGNFWKNPYSFIGPDQNNNRLLLPFYKKISQ